MNKKNIITLIIISIFSLLIFLVIYLLSIYGYRDNYSKLITINDYNELFSISKNSNNYISNLNSTNIENIYYLLDQQYTNRKLINKSNVIKKISIVSEDVSFGIEKILYTKIDENTIYLLSGTLRKNLLEETEIIDKHYNLIMLVDYNSFAVSFYPTTSKELKKDINSITKIDIKRNEYNKFLSAGLITENDMCLYYYGIYYNMLFEDINKAYKLLDNTNYTNSRFEESVKLNNFSGSVKNCEVINNNNEKLFKIEDENGNRFTFKEHSVLNYTVTIN